MNNTSADKEGGCNARLFLADDYGDNPCTLRCQLAPGHKGSHKEAFKRDTAGKVQITWDKDERFLCEHHGLQDAGDYCRLCMNAPVTCSTHGIQEDSMCFHCTGESFICPEHGKQKGLYVCDQEDCFHTLEERWTKILN